MKDRDSGVSHPIVKIGSALSALALAACQVGSKISPPAHLENNNPNISEQTPTTVIIDIDKLVPVPENFAGSKLNGEITGAMPLTQNQADMLTPKMDADCAKMVEQYNIPAGPGSGCITFGYELTDKNGNAQSVIFGLITNSLGEAITPTADASGNVSLPVSGFGILVNSDGLKFVPPGEGLPQAGERLLPLGLSYEGNKTVFSLGIPGSGPTENVLEFSNNQMVYHDPFSKLTTDLDKSRLPAPAGKALYNLLPLSFSPTVTEIVTDTPTESATATSVATAIEAPVVIPDYLQEIPLVTVAPTTEAGLEKITIKNEDIRSGAFAAAIKKAYFEGRIKPFAKGIKMSHPSIQLSENKWGWSSIYIPGTYKIDKRPDKYPGVYSGKDEIGQWYIYIPQVLKTGEGANDINVLTYKFPWSGQLSDSSKINIIFDNFLNSINIGRMWVPAIFYNENGCESFGTSYSNSILNWYSSPAELTDICKAYYNSDDYKHALNLIKQWGGWKADGIDPAQFPSALENVAVFFSSIYVAP